MCTVIFNGRRLLQYFGTDGLFFLVHGVYFIVDIITGIDGVPVEDLEVVRRFLQVGKFIL